MNDLSGLDWSSTSNNTSNTANKTNSSFPSLRPSPSPSFSGRSTPLSTQASGNPTIQRSKPSTPANDSFASLLGPTVAKPTANLSLQERQRQLLEEKAKQEEEQRKRYGAQDSQFWDKLGGGGTTQGVISPISAPSPGNNTLSASINKPFAKLNARQKQPVLSSTPNNEDDILAAFNSAAPVDKSSHFPVPQISGSGRSTPAQRAAVPSSVQQSTTAANNTFIEDDDDPFGLNQLAKKQNINSIVTTSAGNDDDILGMLGKPVSEIPTAKPSVENGTSMSGTVLRERSIKTPNPRDKAIAELVDMGFPAEKSALALDNTESGLNVQAAVGLLLSQAHEESKQKARGREQVQRGKSPRNDDPDVRRKQGRGEHSETRRDESTPAWMRSQPERSISGQRRQENRSPARDKDVAQYATELSSTLFKSANSLWKTGQKKVQRAVADFQQEGDSSQPKWMREAQVRESSRDPEKRREVRSHKASEPATEVGVTDEAMMLESRPEPSRPSKEKHSTQQPSNSRFADDLSEPVARSQQIPSRASPQPRFSQASSRDRSTTGRLRREDVETQSSQAYVSPARRKRVTPTTSEVAPSPEPTPALSSRPHTSRQAVASPPLQSRNPFAHTAPPTTKHSPRTTPIPVRPSAPPRRIPPASSSALSSSTSYRQKGSEAFKRGDYSGAHTAYSSALSPLPDGHPVTIIVLCNRALTNIKTGDPKAAVVDADKALSTIGVSRGEGEKIALGGAEGEKEMKEFYGKALMRKAEALEHMEKWTDAGKIWQEAVEAGVGGSVSIQGRNRCEKAAGGGNQQARASSTLRPTVKKASPPRPSALSEPSRRPALSTAASAEAVKKLRAANAAAEKVDDEKFALADQVDSKLIAWKGTKADNLRALLGSLDSVLWAEAGWKKVGMSDLVMPNKVKIVYMKAIAKVHPDKIPSTATTEQRMISASVFSTLNEAWDKFKKDNNL
ncbi:hypothetical protein M501DRAFT_1014127 [Patellaria atrata CBS 101060]|uniref:UBA domain-containing protein n=1 Tax=Patellaria atrata CBS 101060 TaxID=1346257 RepID=A0A9P4SF03_9PEZI|nr:hypothetical protein M501DRAFT_1014127 [Patellaria atrata CBS 101060]